jgi:hypothetical protein
MLDGLQYEIVPAEPGDTTGVSSIVVCELPHAAKAQVNNIERNLKRISVTSLIVSFLNSKHQVAFNIGLDFHQNFLILFDESFCKQISLDCL